MGAGSSSIFKTAILHNGSAFEVKFKYRKLDNSKEDLAMRESLGHKNEVIDIYVVPQQDLSIKFNNKSESIKGYKGGYFLKEPLQEILEYLLKYIKSKGSSDLKKYLEDLEGNKLDTTLSDTKFKINF